MHKLAVSFIVTVALLPACGASPDYTSNPPEPEVISNPPPPDATPPETPPDATPVPTSDTDTSLPLPAAGDKVVAKPNGTCWVYPDVDCPPPPVTCNPPPPRQVQCPTSE